jgi:transcription initiation factor TFIIIB Brf1 subunit/transcription initiation factor TFIIB
MNNHNEVCLICRSSNVITDSDSGEIVCSKCGMVISDKIQENREESRSFKMHCKQSQYKRKNKVSSNQSYEPRR